MGQRKSIRDLYPLINYEDIIHNYVNGNSIAEEAIKNNIPPSSLYKLIKNDPEYKNIKFKKMKNQFNTRIQNILLIGSDIRLNEFSDKRLSVEEWTGVKDKYYFLCSECKVEWRYAIYDQINTSKVCRCEKCISLLSKEKNKIDFKTIWDEIKSVNSDIMHSINNAMEEKYWGRVVDKYWLKCNKCGNWFYKEYRQFIRDDCGMCTDCKGFVIKWDLEKVIKYCHGVNSEFINNNWGLVGDKYNFKCVNCNNIILKSFTKFYSGQNICKECEMKQKIEKTRKTHEQYLLELKEKSISIKPIEEYRGYDTSILHECPKCKRTDWLAIPSNVLARKSLACPDCRKSGGEEIIASILDENEIVYKREYKFKDLKSRKNYYLRFDFAIFDKEGSLLILIEYDGLHHFKPARYSKKKEKNESRFIEQLERDTLKNDYCKLNQISLLRIPYWEIDSIEDIIIDQPEIKYLLKRGV